MAPARLGASLSLVAGLALLAYPLLVYLAIDSLGVAGIAVGLALVCIVRLVVFKWRAGTDLAGSGVLSISIAGAVLAAAAYWFDSGSAILLYPVLVNVLLLLAFARTLKRPPSMIERIARTFEPTLSQAAVAYTRRVTIVWVVFFAANGALALYTALATPLDTWAWYNGFIAYLLIGALFLAELAVRSTLKARLKS